MYQAAGISHPGRRERWSRYTPHLGAARPFRESTAQVDVRLPYHPFRRLSTQRARRPSLPAHKGAASSPDQRSIPGIPNLRAMMRLGSAEDGFKFQPLSVAEVHKIASQIRYRRVEAIRIGQAGLVLNPGHGSACPRGSVCILVVEAAHVLGEPSCRLLPSSHFHFTQDPFWNCARGGNSNAVLGLRLFILFISSAEPGNYRIAAAAKHAGAASFANAAPESRDSAPVPFLPEGCALGFGPRAPEQLQGTSRARSVTSLPPEAIGRGEIQGSVSRPDRPRAVAPANHFVAVTSRISTGSELENLTGTSRAQSVFVKTPRSPFVMTECTLNFPSGIRGS